jgi:N-acetylmuramoyl-L-alanine amidase
LGAAFLRALLAGPTAQERAQGLTTAFPAGTRLAGFRLEPDRTAVVQLEVPPEALSPLDPAAFEAMVWQLAGTLEPLGWQDLRVQTRDPASGAFVPMEAFLPEMPVPRKEWVSDEGPSVAAAAVPAAAVTPAPPIGGLKGKTVYLSAGHGWLWNGRAWRTQRPPYPTAPYVGPIIEDHNNAEAVNQYLIRYLQNAGATVIPVRERDMNPTAVIVDNDTPGGGYAETGTWVTSTLYPGYLGGTYRYATTVTGTATATATWTFAVPADGEYAVYAWYRQGTNRAPDARYTVHYAGGATEVIVNQRIHGNTWRYLGTFGFRAGQVATVTLSNLSTVSGQAVIADALRVGGGVFSSLTGIYTTTAPYAPNKPWWEVAAYYYVQRMGLDPSGWPSYGYFNDVVARPMYARWEHAGTGEDALYISWHSNGTSYGGYQTTTRGTDLFIHNGITRPVTPGSAELRDALFAEISRSLRAAWDPTWPVRKRAANLGELRELWDPDPAVRMPGVLIEVAYHDHPTDTDALKEPKFNQLFARAVYRGIVRYFETRDEVDLPLLPEPPTHLAVRNLGDGQVQVSWRPPATNTPGLESDPPTGYRVYTSTDGVGWSATALVTTTVYTLTGVPAGELLFVRVTAVNDGGESFPTEVLGVRTPPSVRSEAAGGGMSALLVNGFDRLNRTMLIPETDPVEGFNLRMLLDRMNARNYVLQHGQAISLPFDSASNEAVRDGHVRLADYHLVDWILGEESAPDQTLDPTERSLLRAYLDRCGALLISGTEIGWHLDGLGADSDFYRNTLRAQYVADDAGTYMVTPTAGSIFAGLGSFRFDAPGMYDPDYPDVISPYAGSVAALEYVGGTGGTAAVQYADGCSRLVYLAFPLETIDPPVRAAVMERILDFLILTSEPSGVRYQVFLPLVLRDFGSSPPPVIINGGFETDEGWTLNRLAVYDSSLARSGARSMRLGILPGEPVSQTIYSSVSQSFVVPEGPTVTLSLWVYLRTGGDRDDLFYVGLDDGSRQDRPLDSWRPGDLPENTWVERRVDLTPYAGQRVTLYIGVKNDGDSLTAAMNGDDVGIR